MTKHKKALACFNLGLSVIPLWPNSKQAMVRWVEFQSRCATKEEIDEWWTKEPEANIGIVTGAISGVIVGDVDPRNGGHVEVMKREAPSSYIVKTPGGGAHFYYNHPGGRVKKGKPRPGIDLQSDGCYVVAPGSYVKTDKYEGQYQQVSFGSYGEAPAWLLGAESTEHSAPAQEDWISQTLKVGCPAGTRNDTIARLAGYFAKLDVPEDVICALLWRWVREQDGTKVTQTECARTIQSIYAKERRGRSSKAVTTGYVVDEFNEEDSRPLCTEPLSEFVPKFYREKVEWQLPDWLPDKTIAFLVSPPGRFKTMLTFDAAISIAGGWPFLGQVPVQNPGPVLVIQQEDDYGDMARRFNRIFAARQPGRVAPAVGEDIVSGHLSVSDYPPVHICTTRGFNLSYDNLCRLEDLIRKIRPRVIVIDPLYSITSAEDFMMHAAKDMMPLKRLRDVYETSFLIAAHTRKGADVGREGLWGSQFLNAFLETGWQIRDIPDGEPNQIQVLRHFKSSAQQPPINLEFLLNEDEGYRVALSDPEDEEEVHDVIVKTLKQADPRVLTEAEISEKTGLSGPVVLRRLIKLQKKGLINVFNHPHPPGTPNAWGIPKDTTSVVGGASPKKGKKDA